MWKCFSEFLKRAFWFPFILLLNINTCVFANMVSQCKKIQNWKVQKKKLTYCEFIFFLHYFTLTMVQSFHYYSLQVLICINLLVRDLKYIRQFKDNAFLDYHKHIVCFRRDKGLSGLRSQRKLQIHYFIISPQIKVLKSEYTKKSGLKSFPHERVFVQ